jgi:predicted lipoprotein with Yx(FWY)xxD motif
VRSTQFTFRLRALGALGGVLLVASACTSAGASTAPSVAAPSAASGGTVTVAVASGTVGSYLTGADGKTLYEFTPDTANTSTCTDACATKWPPFTVPSGGSMPTAGSGVTGTLTSFARADGSMQVAINGIPLYYYGGDGKAGDTTGQGVGGKWFVASPAGTAPVASGAPAASPAPTTSGGGAGSGY